MKLERAALRIFQAALRASDPEEAVLRHVERKGDLLLVEGRRYPLKSFRRIYVVGQGRPAHAWPAA